MGQVGVHLDEDIEPALQAPCESRHVGRPETFLARPVKHRDPVVLGRQRVRHPPGAVGGVVVHHEDVENVALFQNPGHDARQVVAFIVGRHDHEYP